MPNTVLGDASRLIPDPTTVDITGTMHPRGINAVQLDLGSVTSSKLQAASFKLDSWYGII